jgi:PIN domain nuclease of toxin-antitoxin system
LGNEVTRLLIDTHVLLWIATGSRKLSGHARAVIADPTSEIWISAASVWEIANKAALGRLRLSVGIAQWLPARMQENALSPLPITQEHAIVAAELPRHHQDPFDLMLIAQALVEDLAILTADTQFDRYDVRKIDATN